MMCSKCGIDKIVEVTLKMNQKKAFVCDTCGIVWFENEDIKQTIGHRYEVLTRGDM